MELEGSVRSYFVVVGAFTVLALTGGFGYSFGVYQAEYVEYFNTTNFQVAWIGTGYSSMTLGAGPIAGYLADRYGHRQVSFMGSAIFTASLFAASRATELWHLYLTMGIGAGLGNSFGYYAGLAVVSQWWVHNRGTANGFVVAGVGIGGFCFGPLGQYLIGAFGWSQALQITAGGCGVALFFACLAIIPYPKPIHTPVPTSEPELRSDVPLDEEAVEEGTPSPAKASSSSDDISKEMNESAGGVKKTTLRQLFSNKVFSLLFLATFFEYFGYYVPFYYISSYTIAQGYSRAFGAIVLGVMNGSSGLGRILLGRVGDRLGYMACFVYCMTMAAVFIFLWMLCVEEWSLLLFAAIFGFHVGGYISLQAPMLATIFGVEQLAGIVGVLYFAGVPGTLMGSAVAGYITDANTPDYKPTIAFASATYTIYVLLLLPVWRESRKISRLKASSTAESQKSLL